MMASGERHERYCRRKVITGRYHFLRLPGTGDTVDDLAEVFTISRATMYRTLQRGT